MKNKMKLVAILPFLAALLMGSGGIHYTGAGGGGGAGDVVGPASSTTNGIATFADTTGKLLASPSAFTAVGTILTAAAGVFRGQGLFSDVSTTTGVDLSNIGEVDVDVSGSNVATFDISGLTLESGFSLDLVLGGITLTNGDLLITDTSGTQANFKGWGTHGGSSATNGQILLGGNFFIEYDFAGTGDAIFRNAYDNTIGDFQFRVRDGSVNEVTALRIADTVLEMKSPIGFNGTNFAGTATFSAATSVTVELSTDTMPDASYIVLVLENDATTSGNTYSYAITDADTFVIHCDASTSDTVAYLCIDI